MMIAKAPRALNPTTAPYRPNTFTSMIGCEVKAIYDANGLKFDALNIVDLATGFRSSPFWTARDVGARQRSAGRRLSRSLQSCCISGVRLLECLGSMTVWPSGLGRWPCQVSTCY
mgnify:CR=1 FL=1